MVAMRFRPGGCFRFIVGRGVLLCCTICMFFWALLVVPAAHGQVIEEGGFPVKGGSISGESFSLSCPSRVFAEAGESVLLSCTATGVPEEGVRYEWESLSGDGLHLLSDANERSPLFTAPLSEAGAEYVYRLTAMSVGVYETATVTVVVGGVSGGSVQDRGKSPGLLEGCDSFGALEGFREGCVAGDKMPPSFEPFEGGLEGEEGPGLLFPEAPGLPDRPSGPVRGGGLGRQTPPYLDCPVAVFLEELEIGSIECHVSDALGEEFLEYMWEPVGSTTRDYLDNPRLIPEDAPNPSVVAPEAPAYETLESFHSGETTFRYRYRLTVTSHATGLSSSSEVEVYVSSSRPSVYCPLEIVVEEGETVALDCEGVDPLSARMDYDEEGASILWEWEGLWGTSTAPLAATHLSSPLFTAPVGSAGKQYHYIASMTSSASGVPRMARRRVTVRVTGAEEGAQAAADDSALMFKGSAPVVTCNDAEIYEATADFTLDCSVTDEPTGATYAWTVRGSTADTDDLSSTTILKPTFDVPDNINESEGADKDYEYTVTMTAGGVEQASEDITVTVLEKPDIVCLAASETPNRFLVKWGFYESRPDFPLNACPGGWTGAPAGSDYTYAWTARGGTPDTRLLSATNIEVPTFALPDAVDKEETYEYTLTVSAENADDALARVEVTVWDRPDITVTCENSPYEVDEGDADIELECDASGAPGSDPQYTWSWSPTANLTGHDTDMPTFDVPGDVDQDTTYTYTVTATADNADDGTASVTVTVLNTPPSIACTATPDRVYEGSADDITVSCSAQNTPSVPFIYAWDGSDDFVNLLKGWNGDWPIFGAPDNVNGDTEYVFTVDIYIGHNGCDPNLPGCALDSVADADVIITVLEKPDITVTCSGNPYTVDEGDGLALDCAASGAPDVNSQYTWSWSPVDRLTDHDTGTPVFSAPADVDQDTTWTYRVTATADNADDGTAEVTVTVRDTDSTAPVITCNDSEVYEATADITLDCSVANEPSGATYAWAARGSTSGTSLLSSTTILKPTFNVPGSVNADTDYDYTVTMMSGGSEVASADVTVTVLEKPDIYCPVVLNGVFLLYAGRGDYPLLVCEDGWKGAPVGSDYAYVWTARGGTADTRRLSATNIETPTFNVPDAVESVERYYYSLTVSAANADDASVDVTVTVLNKRALSVACAPPPLAYEGSADFALDCAASGAPGANPVYSYVWSARGDTPDTALLSAADIASPTFYVPDEVDGTTAYEYLLTVSAENAESGSAAVTVTVLNAGALHVVCTYPPSVYEGSEDFDLDCTASGAPAGSEYAYVWTARGTTANTDLLVSGTDGPTPTFYVPDEVDATTTYEYLLTVSAENAESGSAEVTVTVLKQGALHAVCADPPLVYEGSEDFAFDCSASGAPEGSEYAYAWTPRGATSNTDLLIAGTDGPAPTFAVPDALDATTTYEYLLTVSAENAEGATAEVTVTVLNRGALSVVCADPPSVYEGSEDFALDCSASGAPAGSNYTYAWTARGNTLDTSLLSATDVASPTFYVPDQVESDETYTYRLTVSTSAENIDPGTFDLTVNVYNHTDLDVVCTDRMVYEGSPPFRLQCTASGGPPGVLREWDWSPATHLTGPRIRTPTFTVPTNVESDMTFTYTATVTAGSMVATGELTVTVLNRGVLSVACADPGSVYEGSADITLSCTASGAPSGSDYAYAWTARGSTANTNLLTSGTDGSTPTFAVPDDVNEDETYEYLLTVSAANAEDATAEVTVTVLDRAPLAFVDDSISGRVYVFTVGEVITDILLPEATSGLSPYTYTLVPALPNGLELDDPTRTISGTPLEVSPRTEYTWQATDANSESVSLAFFIEVAPAEEPASVPVAESPPEAAEPSSLESLSLGVGVTVSASSLRFGVQSADTQVSLDPMTDGISTYVSGPYHAGRMTLAPGGSEALDENGEMDLSIELASPVTLRRKGGVEAASIILSPSWSLAESCEQLSSQTIGSLYTEVTLSDADCRLLLFGGELDLTGVPSGRYAGSLDIILRSGESEETHTVDVDVTVIPAQRVITIGPRGVRFSTSRELPVGLTEEQNLSIYPHVAFLTEEKPHGVFELSNPSLIPLEVSVSARFGYTEATENGREVVVEDASGSHLGDLSEVVDIHPGVLVLMPGEKGLIRYGVKEGALAAMAQKGYAAFFDVVSEPRQYVRSDQMPEEVTGDRTARVTMRVPGVYVPGEGASQLRAALLSISYVGSLSATFLVETQDHPFAGEVVAYDGDGRELGRRETLVYTRSRVRISLDRMPEEGAVFLRFSPRGSGRVPEPASIQWDAPRRDIGAADRDHTRPPATLVQKP